MSTETENSESILLTPLVINYAAFKRNFLKKKKLAWARPSIWYDSDIADTVDRTKSEDDAISNILEQSRQVFRYRSDVFTPQQRMTETILAADYAFTRGMTIITFVAWVLLMSDEHARRMLLLSGWKRPNVAENEAEVAIHSRQRTNHKMMMRIEKVRAGIRKECPGRKTNPTCERVVTANHDLCWKCHGVYGRTREEYPNWLRFLVQDDQREFRQQAREIILFEALPNEEAA